MVIQVTFSRLEAMKAGAVVSQYFEDVFADYDGDGNPVFEQVLFSDVDVPEAGVKAACYVSEIDPDELTCDFNHWGGIRPKLEPWLKEHSIRYVEG